MSLIPDTTTSGSKDGGPGAAGPADPPGRIARVVPDIRGDQIFDYAVPDRLAGRVEIGSRVRVPLGRRTVLGTVVGIAAESDVPRLREIDAVLQAESAILPEILALARWMAEYYVCSYERALSACLPAVIRRARRGARYLQIAYPKPGLGREIDLDALEQRAPKQAVLLRILLDDGPMTVPDLVRRAGASRGSLSALEKKGWVRLASEVVARNPFEREEVLRTGPLEATAAQAAAVEAVTEAIREGRRDVFLVHGVTGSGKTEVYLQAIAYALARGRGAIVLVPEIALTPQTTERFRSRFGDVVAVLHSHLSDGERHDEWFRIRKGAARIVVGARSAVFAPVCDLGLIVVDEEHETTYKQAETPRYHARDVAVVRARRAGIPVVLGSATPSLESYHNALTGKYRLLELPARIDGRSMPEVRAVDMRQEAVRAKAPRLLSQRLVDAVRARLERGEQVMLFLNRRGYATSFLCPSCGYVATCPDCSVPFTVHRAEGRLLCHLCGRDRPLPDRCPQCGDPSVRLAGVGTEKLVETAARLFPQARIERMDSDTTTRRGAHGRILSAFRAGRIDILVGTQMIAKGLDFPNVTLVGIVFADQSLHLPDFRAGERTFQLLTQVAGRSGRGEVGGEVIVQTYTPGHAAIIHALNQDFAGFYREEIEFRRELLYPPVARMVLLGIRDPNEQRAQLAAAELADRLEKLLPPGSRLSGPAPAPIARIQGMYRYQVIARSRNVRRMIAACARVIEETPLPPQTRSWIDVDPVFLM